MHTTESDRRVDVPKAPLAPLGVPPLFRFPFQKQYSRLYSNRHDKFVLREEHIAELKRLVKEHNSDRSFRAEALSMSDIVNAALDFALEHPIAFHCRVSPDTLRESLSREVYRKAFLHFMRHEIV
ncbi:MAG: hypothetical protein KGJ84_03450 [Elusimicrobia bacterium]|nr:hypothetical protein [Elusimicrobiota bacterium]